MRRPYPILPNPPKPKPPDPESLLQQYRDQVARLYGEDCAQASLIELTTDTHFRIAIADPQSGRFVRESPDLYTAQQLDRMIEVLSQRKPLERS